MVSAARSSSARALAQLLEECDALELEVSCLGADTSAGPLYRFSIDAPPPAQCSCKDGCCTGGKINLNPILHRIIGQAARHRIPGEAIHFNDECVVQCAARSGRDRSHCDRCFHVRVKGVLKRFGRC